MPQIATGIGPLRPSSELESASVMEGLVLDALSIIGRLGGTLLSPYTSILAASISAMTTNGRSRIISKKKRW